MLQVTLRQMSITRDILPNLLSLGEEEHSLRQRNSFVFKTIKSDKGSPKGEKLKLNPTVKKIEESKKVWKAAAEIYSSISRVLSGKE